MELKDYVKNYLDKGYSIEAIRKVLVDNGHKAEDVDKVHQELKAPKGDFLVEFAVQAGFSGISILLTLLLLLIIDFMSISSLVGYTLIGLAALGLGYFANYVINHTGSNHMRVISGVVTPIIPVVLIVVNSTLVETVEKMLELAGGVGSFLVVSLFNLDIVNGLVAAIIFYVCFNVFIVFNAFIEEGKWRLVFLIFIPFIIMLIFFGTNLLAESVVMTAEDAKENIESKLPGGIKTEDIAAIKDFEQLSDDGKDILMEVADLPPAEQIDAIQHADLSDEDMEKLQSLVNLPQDQKNRLVHLMKGNI